jgi:outer membrane protein assembly factor BamA
MNGEPADGRQPKKRVADDLLVVPRLLLTPPRLLWKGLSYPIQAMANGEERHHFSQKLYLLVTSWDGTIGIRPEISYQLSFTPFFGATFFHNKLLGPGTGFDVTFMLGASSDNYYARVRMRPFAFRHATQLHLLTQFNERDDQLFTGIGMDHTRGPSRYRLTAFDIDAQVRAQVRPEVRLQAGAQFGFRRFGNSSDPSGDPAILDVYCVRAENGLCTHRIDNALVPGFTGTQFLRVDTGFRVDTRDSSFRPTSGAVAELQVDYSHGLDDPSSYFRLSASAMGVIDLWKRSHILLLRAWGMGVFPINDEPVPFTELVVLGGPDDLRGVRWGLYRDYTGMLFTAEYRWPIWMWMDASLFTDFGGVFGRHWNDFELEKLKPDVGAGIRIRTSTSFLLRLQTAWSPADGWQLFVAATAVP